MRRDVVSGAWCNILNTSRPCLATCPNTEKIFQNTMRIGETWTNFESNTALSVWNIFVSFVWSLNINLTYKSLKISANQDQVPEHRHGWNINEFEEYCLLLMIVPLKCYKCHHRLWISVIKGFPFLISRLPSLPAGFCLDEQWTHEKKCYLSSHFSSQVR